MKRNFLILLVWLCLAANATFAQTTAFSYQGKLTDAGNPANGNFDLQFKLFDTVTVGAGTQQGATLVRNPVAVSAGVFTVTLDFGANVFSGADRYLEIGVRPAGSVNAYTVLAPRQPLTASPYAIQTLNAQQLGGLPASSYLQNTNTPQAGANLNIGGSGTMGSLNVNGPVSLGGVAAPAVAPTGQGRLYFDSTTNKLRVSESGGAFVNLVGATGVSGSGTVNSLPLWSAGTTLGSSLIAQAGNAINMPNNVIFGASTSGHVAQFGSPNSETGLTFSGGGFRADIRYDGTLKIVNGLAGGPPGSTQGIAIDATGKVGIGTTSPNTRLNAMYDLASGCGPVAIVAAATAGGNLCSNALLTVGNSDFNTSLPLINGLRGINQVFSVDAFGTTVLAGNLGVKTPSPQRDFHVNGRARVSSIPLEASIATVCFNAAGDLLQCGASSLKWKTNVQPYRAGLAVIQRLRPLRFDWQADGRPDFGLGAEHVARVAPDLVFSDDKGEVIGVKYEKLSLLLINAVQELKAQNDRLQRRVRALEQRTRASRKPEERAP